MRGVTQVRTLDDYRIWLRYEDGTEGEIDLSDLVGKGVFKRWNDPEEFEWAFVDPETRTMAWPGRIALCPDALYKDLLGAPKA